MSRSVARAARSNDRVLDLISESAPDIPPWVFRQGRARMVGFALQIARAGDLRGGAAFLSHLAAGQPREVGAMLFRISGWLLHEAAGRRPVDPELGVRFEQADPITVPWEGHMLLSPKLRLRLDNSDVSVAAAPLAR
jgi:hypothetical protein